MRSIEVPTAPTLVLYTVSLMASKGSEDGMDPRLGVVIANWNGLTHLLTCLESLRACRPQAGVTVVVDNGSKDGSPQQVSQRFPEVLLVANTQNLGFATAMNIGARMAVDRGCDYVLFLNNDTIVAEDALGMLLDAVATPGVEIANPLITDGRGRVWFSGASVNPWTAAVKHRRDKPDPNEGLIPIGSATGCAMVMRAWAVRELGPFEERYFAYYEDSDISATIRRRGGQIVLQPAAVVQHLVSADGRRNASTAFYLYLFTRNRLLFARRQLQTPWILFLVRFTVGYVVPRLTALLLVARMTEARAFLRGYLDYFRGRFGDPQIHERSTRRA